MATIGWLTFTAGFADQNVKQGQWNHSASGNDIEKMLTTNFVYYGLSVFGLLGTLSMLCYSAKRSACLGATAMLINIFMILCAGGVMNETGSVISKCFHYNSTANGVGLRGCVGGKDASIQPYLQAEFAGAFLYTIFQTFAMTIFFYKAHGSSYDNFA